MDFLNSISYIGFYALAAITIICAFGMIFNPNLVRAGFTLIGCFTAIAGLYFTLYANFVAVSQILIYAVGIVLVIVFAVMLCSLKDTAADMPNTETAEGSELFMRRCFATAISAGIFYVLSYIITHQNWELIKHLTGAVSHEPVIERISSTYTTSIGFQMLREYLIPFELISVLLLVVLVGVVILSKKNIEGKKS